MRDLLNDFAGLDFQTPEDAHAWLDSQRGLSDLEKRRVLSWIVRWETKVGQAHVEWLTQRSAQIKEEHDRVVGTLEEGRQRTAQVEHLIATGRMTKEAGAQELTGLSRQHQECLKIQASIRREIERWEAEAERSPSDRLREMQGRFNAGAPRYGVETLTMAVLRGESGGGS